MSRGNVEVTEEQIHRAVSDITYEEKDHGNIVIEDDNIDVDSDSEVDHESEASEEEDIQIGENNSYDEGTVTNN